jgi:hypothetical protein
MKSYNPTESLRFKNILILYNLAERLEKGVANDLVCEQEIRIIVPLVVKLLKKKGCYVETLKADLDLWEQLKKRKNGFDMVFNLAEAFGGGNSNEPVVPAMLEGLKLPFTGASLANMVFLPWIRKRRSCFWHLMAYRSSLISCSEPERKDLMDWNSL